MRLIIIVFLSFISASGAIAQPRTEMLLIDAETNIKNAKYDDALSKVKEALAIEPGNIKALQLQINIYYLKNDYKQALNFAEKAISQYPGESEFYYQRGLVNNGRGKYRRAIADFDKLINTDSGTELFKVFLNRGISLMNILEYERATDDFTKSIELNGNNASAYHSRGMLNYQLRDFNASVLDFKKALEINVNNPETNFNLGMAYFRLGDRDNACPYFQKACKEGNVNSCKMVLMECARNLPK